MKIFKKIQRAFIFPLVGILFATSVLATPTPVFAAPNDSQNSSKTTNNSKNSNSNSKKSNSDSRKTGNSSNNSNNSNNSSNGSNSSNNATTRNNTNNSTTDDDSTDSTTNNDQTDENSAESTNDSTNSDNKSDSDKDKNEEDDDKDSDATCYSQIGNIAWIICPTTAFLAKGIDLIYGLIENFLVIQPISTEDNSPVFTVWTYIRNITNIIFIIFLMIIIYSQITGIGISNYGIKKALPRLCISAVLVNLSWIICILAVDFSNIIGASLNSFLNSVADNAISSDTATNSVSFYDLFTTIAAGGVIGTLAVGAAGGPLGLLLALIPVIIGGIISVIIGFVTIALRQAVVILLIAVAPLAFVAYLLPNTEEYYKKWKKTFSQMLFFYPMFALLYGASRLASMIFISSATNMLGVILGLAIEVLPLFLGFKLMQMAGTVLGGLNSALSRLGNRATSGIRSATDPYRDLQKRKQLARGMRQPFNALSIGSWRASAAKRRAKVDFENAQLDKTNQNLQAEQLNALRRNTRIIGYNKNNQPIYTQLPVRNGRGRRSNRYMDAEAEARETGLRAEADSLKTENAYGSLGDYLKEQGITEGKAVKTASQIGSHYLKYRTEQEAKARNDEADERFYNDAVKRAAERDTFTGKLKHQNDYRNLVTNALGSTGYKVNQTTAEGRRLANEAAVNVIGDAYSRDASARAANVKRFEAYMDKQVTAEVVRQYEDMIKYDNIDGIVASHEILAKRGDYDKIAEHMRDYLNSGHVKLGEDASNTLAMNFLGMKDSAPALARLGKFMNMETWQYTSGNRPQTVTMDQYVTGLVPGAVKSNGQPYQTKINLAVGLEGTKLTGIDRTAYGALEAITKAFSTQNGYTVDQASDKLFAIERTMMPQEVSALPTFASGSEQIRSMVSHITGTKYNSETGKWEDIIHKISNKDDQQIRANVVSGRVDANGVRKGGTVDTYLNALTARDLISMKSDTWGGIVARIKYDRVQEHNAQNPNDIVNIDSDRANELAYEDLRKKLETRITKIAQGNMNLDMMKEPIYKALKIEDRRKEEREKRIIADDAVKKNNRQNNKNNNNNTNKQNP